MECSATVRKLVKEARRVEAWDGESEASVAAELALGWRCR